MEYLEQQKDQELNAETQSEFLPSAWSAQAEIPHPHGNAQIDSLSYPADAGRQAR